MLFLKTKEEEQHPIILADSLLLLFGKLVLNETQTLSARFLRFRSWRQGNCGGEVQVCLSIEGAEGVGKILEVK